MADRRDAPRPPAAPPGPADPWPPSQAGIVKNFLIWVSGAQPDLIEQAPGDRAKYQGIGGAVLTTATLASVSMYFALEMAVRAPWWGALFIALIWFCAILNLD